SVAVPALRVAVPSGVPPSLNATVPAGVPLPGAAAATVAVNVTVWPATDGSVEDATVVVVFAVLTVSVNAADVLALKPVSPPYIAVIEWTPTDNADIANVAAPPLTGAVPIAVAPSINVTVPVGAPLPGGATATIAVNVTASPNTDGFSDEL